MQSLHSLFRVVPQGVSQRNQAFCLAILNDHHHRLPGLFKGSELRRKMRGREFIRGANKHFAACNLGFNPRSHQRPLCGSCRNRQPAGLRFTHNRLGQWVSGALFNRGGQREQVLLVDLVWKNTRYLRLADRQGAGFVERHLLHLRQLLQRRAAFDQRTPPGCCRQPGGNGRRGGDHQRARTTNQQQGQPFVDPARPRRAEQQRRHHGHQQRNQHNCRGIDAAEAVDKALHRGAALFCLFNQLQDPVDGAVARFRQHGQLHKPIHAGGPGRDFFTCRAIDRDRFPGQGAFIKAGGGSEQRPVGGQASPRGNLNHIPRAQRGDGYGFALALYHLNGGFGL